MLDRVGYVGHERRRLRVDLAPLQAEPAIDAMRPVAKRAVGDPNRAHAHLDPELARGAPGHVGAAGDRVRGVRIAVRISPRPVLAGHRQLELEPLVVRLEILVGDRPVRPHAVARVHLEVGRMEARAVAGVVDHRAADAVTAVVLAELDRIRSADDPVLGPVQPVRARLVRHPVLVRIPERPGLEHDHLPPAAREPLRQRPAAGAGADDHHVDGHPVVVVSHPLPRNGAPVDVEQERRVVLGRSERARAAQQ